MQVVCDAGCKQQFDVKGLLQSNLTGGVKKAFFVCPHCQQQYVSYYTDKEIRKLQEKVRSRRMKGLDTIELQRELKVRMDALRKKVEGIA